MDAPCLCVWKWIVDVSHSASAAWVRGRHLVVCLHERSLRVVRRTPVVFPPINTRQVPAGFGRRSPAFIMRLLAQFLVLFLNLLVVASVSHEHSTRLYRASRVGGTSTMRMDPAKKMRVDDITIVDVELPEEEDDGTPLRLLTGPGVERRWAWPTLMA